MMIRMLAMDLDDTLLAPDLSISPRNRRAIQEAAARGVTVVFATGRMYQSTLAFTNLFDFDIICLCYNGALVKSSKTKKIWDAWPLPLPAAKKAIACFKEQGLKINVYLDDELYMEEMTPEGMRYARMAKVQPHCTGRDLREILWEAPHKVLGIGEPKLLDAIQPRLAGQWTGEVFLTRSKPYYLEALAPGLSKGAALSRLAAKLGIAREEVMAIGDAPNDLEMIRWAGIGVAMQNGHAETIKAADCVAPNHWEDGVAWTVEKYIINKEG
ncbi:MAG TPA: Cof-type HAD-IIB family hydrolase [Bacillota bacterium]|jgi:Cof subfamily protein (haloacid dehalogenase superfamily)|nr:Cof-type HAD-IIB family hydrolase [Bacillota bacterium]